MLMSASYSGNNLPNVLFNRKPGRFLLTGSANLLQLPRLADSLAGRIEHYLILLACFSCAVCRHGTAIAANAS